MHAPLRTPLACTLPFAGPRQILNCTHVDGHQNCDTLPSTYQSTVECHPFLLAAGWLVRLPNTTTRLHVRIADVSASVRANMLHEVRTLEIRGLGSCRSREPSLRCTTIAALLYEMMYTYERTPKNDPSPPTLASSSFTRCMIWVSIAVTSGESSFPAGRAALPASLNLCHKCHAPQTLR
jgi:cytochrome c553